MPSELDPLLPHNDGSPEIIRNGDVKDIASDKYSNENPNGVGTSSLRNLLAMFTFAVGFALFIAWLSLGVGRASSPVPQSPAGDVTPRVNRILSTNPLIDGHNDLAFLIRYIYGNRIYNSTFTNRFEKDGLEMHVDLPRLHAGKVGGTFWSAFVLCPTNGTDFSDGNYAHAVSATLSQIDLLRRLTAAYPDVFSSPDLNSSTAADTFDIHHRLISPIGIEGLHSIGNSFSNLRLYYSLGVRYATLTHNCHNEYADAALVTNASGQTVASTPLWGGVSPIGQTLIHEMNRLGMLVDLAHVSKDTMIDVLGGRPEKWTGSRAPVIFSHSSAFALCPHPRNVADDVLELVKRTNSLVMVNFSPDFISCTPSNSTTGLPDFYPPNSTVHQVARHVKYIGDTIGYHHVGLGSDFDGILETPRGLEDVGKYPDLISELLEMGVTDEEASWLVGRNVLRVWRDADAVASKMKAEAVKPAEDTVKEL
ncbi:MAG: hypothetical protein L6R36_000326 [Xanthoria steineri]|nr:MAG: hypothetical protein L6R36_000326 [Xanthoria steineri]